MVWFLIALVTERGRPAMRTAGAWTGRRCSWGRRKPHGTSRRPPRDSAAAWAETVALAAALP